MDDPKLQQLFDKEAIKEVRFKFAQALDYKDWALLESLLLPELDTDFTLWGIPPQRAKREDFINYFKQPQSREGLKTQHIFSNFRIEVESDTANCKSYLLAQHFIEGFLGGEEFFLRAEYEDRLLRTEAGWKISAVKLAAIFYLSGNPKILVG
jgi:hypothetical protein